MFPHQNNETFSICQAYINAKLLLWALEMHFESFIVNHQISFSENVDTMASMKRKPKEFNQEEVLILFAIIHFFSWY